MEPIAETTEAFDDYGPFVYGDGDLQERLETVADTVGSLVPGCIGLSLSLVEEQLTFTLVASSATVAALDAVQYVDGGPCLEAMDAQDVVAVDGDPLDEHQWRLYAVTSAAEGVASSLSLPLVSQGETIGGFNLYGATPTTFDGHHDQLAEVLGAWAGGAVRNADLSFSTRELARRAPLLLRESTTLAVAVGLLASTQGIAATEAEERLRQAAVRSGTPLPALADTLIEVLRD